MPLIGLDDFHPGCEQHAYCIAIDRALEGQAVTVLFGIDPDTGLQSIHTAWHPLVGEHARFASHTSIHVRAAAVVIDAVHARAYAVSEGSLR